MSPSLTDTQSITRDQTPDADLVVVSDLHLGRGRNPATGRFYNLEAFFFDDDFLSFCRYLCADTASRNVPLTLVLNGDVFDLLRLEPAASPAAASLSDRLYGAPSTPDTAPHAVRQILAGHPGFVTALAEVAHAGHDVVILAGNHDIENQWPAVRDEIRQAVAAVLAQRAPPAEVDAAVEHLVFLSWFYHVPRRIWIEHGCQYDPANAFRYPLRGKVTDVQQAIYAAEHDMPLGNFFQRYLYNAFGHLTFIVPDARANARYLRWFLINEPRLLLRVIASHVPFAMQVLRRLAKPSADALAQMESAHAEALARLASSSGLGKRLLDVDALKDVEADAVAAVRSIGRQLFKTLAIAGSAMLAAIAVWTISFVAINDMKAGMGLRALLFITLNFTVMAAGAGGLLWYLLRSPKSWKGKELENAAAKIAEIVDVPIVTFGHTHVETIASLPRREGAPPSWYYNTGTWIAVFTNDTLVPRERVQYTYLHVRGHEAQLLHWSPGRGKPLSVVLLDESPAGP